MIRALSYVIVGTPNLPAWQKQAAEHIGLQVEVVEPGRCVRLRADQKVQRLLLEACEGEPSMGMGFEVGDAEELEQAAQALTAAGYPVTRGTAQENALRGVAGMLHFRDPDGVRIEVAWGLADAASPFVPGRPLGGFRTGELGIGHVALITAHFEQMCHLYKEVLGFKVSDRARAPFRVEFLHVNPRHHTLGIAHTGGPAKIYHMMLEYNDFDDLGRAYDMALADPECIGVTLGRHINDHVTSFYLKNPDGWMFELGWAGRTIGPDWEVEELQGMSLWGHDRTWLPPDKREEARQILKRLAAQGMRAPVVTTSQTAKARQ
ncbi:MULTISPECIES: VOC family protein [unclassified Pseudomonas]|uniref:VOC family protein n=1 Tax=unclassified Pseudomonas TaxID=196821 RepID=UPI0002A28C09|nr:MULTISPECIES: VOC family protein [unclassified Pseudomonas]MBB1609265.1 glyoxalase [Pseudomonas sp. UMC76]MBB1640233.1 glyoxalase [Pseudomonas sp. UME83]NTX89341.1 glyoxalase [Pseudomonas sp. UMA643]NTY20219.1 glyoxalase [Pseudomonas sp. UMC3103]NTY25878.1 glyoxalase [Pseudomonas sp. UMA603]